MNNVVLEIIDEREVLGQTFRVYGDLENPLFLAKDVANWIDYNKDRKGNYNVSEMLEMVDDDEKIKIYTGLPTTLNAHTPVIATGATNRWFLTEDGLYEILMQSRKPIAKQFKKEVKRILKQIRKTGGYIPVKEEDDELTILSKAVLIAQKTIEKKDEIIKDLETKNKELQTDLEDCKILQNIIKSNDKNLYIGDFSKLLCNNGIKIGRNTLFKWLRDNGQITKIYGNYSPNQKALNNGYLRYEEQFVDLKGRTRVNYFILVTPKGVVYYAKKLLEEQLKKELEE